MITGTYDNLVNLIVSVQGFRKAETDIHRLNRALDALNRKLAITRSNMAALAGLKGLGSFSGGGSDFGGAFGGAAAGAAAARATGGGSRWGGSKLFPNEHPDVGGGRRGGIGPMRMASWLRGNISPVSAWFGLGGSRGQSVSLGGLGLSAALIGAGAGAWGLAKLMEREQQQLLAYTLANEREKAMLFPAGFHPKQTNWKMYNLTQRYGLEQGGLMEGFKIGKTYGIPFDEFLDKKSGLDEFGKMFAGLSIYADNPERMRRAFLALGQMWRADRVELRDARQAMELGIPLQEILYDKGIDLRQSIDAQDRMSPDEREDYRRFLIQSLVDHFTGKDGRITQAIEARPNTLFGQWAAFSANIDQAAKSLGDGVDAGGQFTEVLKEWNTGMRESMGTLQTTGQGLFVVFNALNEVIGGITTALGYIVYGGYVAAGATADAAKWAVDTNIFSGGIEPTGEAGPGVDDYLPVSIEVVDKTKNGIIVVGGNAAESKFGSRHRKDGLE